MLAGFAVAQHEWHQSNPSYYIELMLANDGNDTRRSKQIAKRLRNDSGILAVIGSNSSGEYESCT